MDDNSDDEEIPRGCEGERDKLLAKRSEIVSMLRIVRQNLAANDQPFLGECISFSSVNGHVNT